MVFILKTKIPILPQCFFILSIIILIYYDVESLTWFYKELVIIYIFRYNVLYWRTVFWLKLLNSGTHRFHQENIVKRYCEKDTVK